MTSKTFTPGTIIDSPWLNDVNRRVYGPPQDTDSSTIGWTQSGVGAVLRTLQEKARQSISPRDFGAMLDGSNDDAVAVQAAFTAANGSGKKVVFDGPGCKIGSGLSQANHAHYDVDWGGCQVSFTGGVGAYLLDMTQAGRIKHCGGVFAGSGANHLLKTGGSAAAQATAYPTIPSEDQWTRQIEFKPQVVTGFDTALDLKNFTREFWFGGDFTGNKTSLKCTGKVVNVYGTDGVLYSGIAASQALVVRGDAVDAAYRYAEGLFFSNCIADTVGIAVDVRDVFVLRWSGGQIKSAPGTVGIDITKGVTPLTRDLFISDVLMQGAMRAGSGLAAAFQFQIKSANLTFNGVSGAAIDIQAFSKGVTVNGASFDGGTSTPKMFAVGANCSNIKLDGLVPDVTTYTNAPTIDATSVAGVEAEFSGPWVPGVAFGGASVGVTYSTQSGRYYYRGGMVSGFGQISLTNKGSSVGAATLTGLPFACGLLNGAAYVNKFASMNTAFTPVMDITVNTSAINVKTGASGGEVAFSNADFSNNSVVNFSFSYPVA